jgi:hypothetical protein
VRENITHPFPSKLSLYTCFLLSTRSPSVAIMTCTEITCSALLEGKHGRFEQVGQVFKTQIAAGADMSTLVEDLHNGMDVERAKFPGRLFCSRYHRLTRTSRQTDKVQRFKLDRDDADPEPSEDGLGLDDDVLGLDEPAINVAVVTTRLISCAKASPPSRRCRLTWS